MAVNALTFYSKARKTQSKIPIERRQFRSRARRRVPRRLSGSRKTKRNRRLIRNQDRKIPGFRSHRTGQLFSSLFAERPINLDPVVRIVCAATKALTLTRSFRRSSPPGWLVLSFPTPWFPSRLARAHPPAVAPQQNSNLTYLHITGDAGELPYPRVYMRTRGPTRFTGWSEKFVRKEKEREKEGKGWIEWGGKGAWRR